MSLQRKRATEKAEALIRDAGGRVVGRTRLQKMAYLLEIAGLGEEFEFEYRHYGPYSEELASAARDAVIKGVIKETEKPASWGGVYSIFSVSVVKPAAVNASRMAIAKLAVKADPIELELAATAAFLKLEGEPDPWSETAARKPEKAQDGRLERAKKLYKSLQGVQTPKPLPAIP